MTINLHLQSQSLKNQANTMLKALNLLPLWQAQGGQPYQVGALPLGSTVAVTLFPGIDMEINFDAPTLAMGLAVLQTCATRFQFTTLFSPAAT